MYDPKKHHRHSVRLPHYDYRDAGAYFITICAAQKRAAFGRLENGAVLLNSYGEIVAEEWLRTAEIRPEIALDEYIVMPDHFHAIVWITKQPTITDQPNVGARLASPNGIAHSATLRFATFDSQRCGSRGFWARQASPLRLRSSRMAMRPMRRNFRSVAVRVMFGRIAMRPNGCVRRNGLR